jgi:hypothetical protein
LFKLTINDKRVARLTDNTDFIQSWAISPDGKKAMTVHAQYLNFEWGHKILLKVFLCDLVKGERKEILAGRPQGLGRGGVRRMHGIPRRPRRSEEVKRKKYPLKY